MKKRLTFLIGISVVLIGTLVYAADRKKQGKNTNHPGDDIHEEEALRAELLDAVEGHDKKSNVAESSVKATVTRTDEKSYHAKSGK